MKNVGHLLNALIIAYTFLLLQGNVNAAFWEDHFEQEAVEDWQHLGDDAVWTIEDGFLRAEIQAQNQWSVIFERYQLIAYPGPYNDFTITLETVGATRARFGIALAKHFRNPLTEMEENGYYLFFTNDMQASRDGGVFVGPERRWPTDTLQQMELHFKDGRFHEANLSPVSVAVVFNAINSLLRQICYEALSHFVEDMRQSGTSGRRRGQKRHNV